MRMLGWRAFGPAPTRLATQRIAAVRTQIIVPCYNEETRFAPAAFDQYLGTNADVGFVLVNDGSSDGTLRVLRELEQRWPGRVKAIDLQPNQGKAEAVRVGMLHAMAQPVDYVGYFDADLATPLDAIADFISVLERNPRIEIVIGSRVALLGRQIDRKPSRHYLGRIFATAASLVLSQAVYDTQCGAKLFRASSATQELFAKPFGSRWIFDVEILARYLVGSGSKEGLYELPLQRWTDVGESRVKARDFLRAGGEMSAIYRNYLLRRDLALLLGLLSAPFVRYVSAGGVGTGVHYATLALCVELFRLSPTSATIVGAFAGAAVNYLLNYHFTFASNASHRVTLPRFFVVAAVSAALNGAGMWYALQRLHIHYLLAQLACTGGVLVIGFVFNRAWTFRADTKPDSIPLA
jgi:dolichyl-phosphate beta-glucosyltransferase